MILYRFATLIMLLGVMFAAPAFAQNRLEVEVQFEGIGESLRRELRPVAALARKPDVYTALAPVRRAANGDAEALLAALRSKGYYAATVVPSIERDAELVTVTFTIERGERFEIESYEITYVDERPEPRPRTLEDLGLEPVEEPTGAALQELENAILERLWNRGYLGAEIARRELRSDFSKGTATAFFALRTGAEGHYGDIQIEGLERTEPEYIRQFRTFESGDLAQREDLDEYRERLVETSLFSEIEISPQLPAEDGTTDILIRLDERRHRTLGGGVNFATDIGPGLNVFWENRNFLKRGEILRAAFDISELQQELTSSFRKTRPRLPGYYDLNFIARNQNTDAFDAQTLDVGGAIGKLWLNRNFTTEGGIRYQYSDITERDCFLPDGQLAPLEDDQTCDDVGGELRGDDELFRAFSFPLSAVWNSQEAPLDPQEGFIMGLTVTPFVGTEDFQKFEASYIDRVFWGEEDGGTLAGRFKLGAIYGAGRADIPATERFYAGGGGSIRGYAFQRASPLDRRTGDPLGGASVAEINIEARQHVTEAIEIALFADAGQAFENNNPDFENVLVGAGLGVRYHTPIGPIRIDLAVPLDRREINVPNPDFVEGGEEPAEITQFEDDPFQIYIGLGQPF